MSPPSRGRRLVRRAIERLLRARARALDDADLRRPALVVAPHFDDETLGCGGTILCKRALGARVHVLFVTDGARSHARWMDAAELAARRAAEGRAAAAALGVDAGDVTCLDLPEGRLAVLRDEGARAVHAILERVRPEQVFVPHRREPPADHAQTFALALQAVERWGRPVTLFEYPVWLWDRRPWTAGDDDAGGRGALRRLADDLRAAACLLRELDRRVDVASVRAAKIAALARHATQTQRPVGQPDWPVLADVRDGEWLARLLEHDEFFASRRVGEA